jgi:tryptophan synthase alpha subunit
MTSRTQAAIEQANAEGRVGFIACLVAGYPDPDATPALAKALVEAGTDVIELVLPFSDPLADGATIQRAANKALQDGMSVQRCPGLIRDIRSAGVEIPLIVMTYYNPILAYGQDGFVKDVAEAGADGLIAVDVPPEEAEDLSQGCKSAGLDFVPLLAPTSTDERVALAVRQASGFVYCVSVAGVTGAREALPEELGKFLQRARKQTDLPLGVGFGISSREQIESLKEDAHAVIVASAIVEVIEAAPRDEREERVQAYVEVLTGRRQVSD